MTGTTLVTLTGSPNPSLDLRHHNSKHNEQAKEEAGSDALYDFLVEARLDQFFERMQKSLKLNSVSELKFVKDDDLQELGFSKTEQRRLRKQFSKYFSHVYLKKFKQVNI